MLNSVVLPALFGPMTAKMAPSRHRETHLVDRDQAAEAPADGPVALVAGSFAILTHAEPARQRRPHAVGQHHDWSSAQARIAVPRSVSEK